MQIQLWDKLYITRDTKKLANDAFTQTNLFHMLTYEKKNKKHWRALFLKI